MMLSMTLMPSCQKAPPSLLSEDKVISTLGCTCPEDVSEYMLIGKRKFARMERSIEQCRARLLIEELNP